MMFTSFFALYRILKPVFDAVLTVPTDDSPTALAAAAVLYLMACDVCVIKFSSFRHL